MTDDSQDQQRKKLLGMLFGADADARFDEYFGAAAAPQEEASVSAVAS